MLKSLAGKYKNTKHLLSTVKETIRAGYPARRLKVIGVTGTDGKTTTCHLIYHILKSSGKKVALLSTVAAYIGDKVIDTGFHTTTPDAKHLQPLIKQVADSGMEYLVLETTSHGLDQHRVLGTNFLMGVLTNVTQDHFDYHKNFENYRKAKAKLFKNVKYAVLNKDDKSFEYFKDSLKRNTNLASYALNPGGTLVAKNIIIGPGGMEFTIVDHGQIYKVKTSLIGKYNASNILASIVAARFVQVEWKDILSALESFKGVEGRMDIVPSNKNFTTIVDFAHTPNSLENVLQTLLDIKPKNGRIICVFGCASKRDVEKRPIMGAISVRLADVSIITAEDPRREDPNKIIEEIAEGASKINPAHEVLLREPDRRKAIQLAVGLAKKDDIIIICGKGHEKSMNIGGKELPWSDKKEALAALSS
ncbi:MAG: UDP-N-acetylmuramoyl-L-alanyl-D-glutamate--2,6-diaminopimelate ligase [bacterium]|nr:UDP-N-acetylmuramoyl-L-alanyl-D-glutamate--2,6-diaminopimelate ligase [bacterium]